MKNSLRLLSAFIAPLVIVLAGLYGFTSPFAASAQTPTGPGVIEGRALLASADASAVLGDLPASLFTFIDGVRQVPPAVGQTDAQGRVRFTGLNTGAQYSYTLFIKYQDTIYRSDVITFAAGSTLAQANVQVYASSIEQRALRIDQHHLIIDLDDQDRAVAVLELYVLLNSGDRTIVGAPDSAANGRNVSFRAPLPPDAIVDSIEERTPNQDIFQANNQLLDTVPIAPGQSSLVFAYRLPYQRSTYALAIPSPLTTTVLNVLVAPNIGVRSPRMTFQGNVMAGNRQFQHFTERDLPAGGSVAIELLNLPAPIIPMDVIQWLPLAVVSLALAVALFISLRRSDPDAAARRQTPA